MRKTTLEIMVKMLQVTSDDATRYHLNAVDVSSDGSGKVTLRATDGHIALTRVIDDADFPKGKFSFYRESKALAALLLKEGKARLDLETTIDDAGALVISGVLAKLRVEKASGTEFPNLDVVTPKHETKVAITFNAELLLALADAINDDKRGTPSVRLMFDPTKPTSPIIVERSVDNGTVAGVLMPMRDEVTTDIGKEIKEKLFPAPAIVRPSDDECPF